MKTPKFRVKAKWSTDFIIVDGDELEKFYYAKRKGAFFAGRYGGIDTKEVTLVQPDYKETYGCMPEYELVGEDFDEIMRAHGDIRILIGKAEERVRYLIESNQENLIGTGVKIPALDRPTVERREGEVKSMKELVSGSIKARK